MNRILVVILLALPYTAWPQEEEFTIDCLSCNLKTLLVKFKKAKGIDHNGEQALLDKDRRITLKQRKFTSSSFVRMLSDSFPKLRFVIGNDQLTFKENKEYREPPKTQPLAKSGRVISGFVSDASDRSLPYATVSIKRRNTVSTDAQGHFKLFLRPNDTLTFSYGGYNEQQYYWHGQNFIRIWLQKPASDPTIVLGYSPENRRANTGNIVILQGDQLHAGNLAEILRTSVPGLLITQQSGVAGGSYHISIRGTNSIGPTLGATPSDDPLIIFNGVPLATFNQPLNQTPSIAGDPGAPGRTAAGLSPLFIINAEDIESIMILKDAAATAIYGSRGANGVILIRTKRAGIVKPVLHASTFVGVGNATYIMPTMNTEQYRRFRYNSLVNSGWIPSVANAPDIYLLDSNKYTNFGKYLLGNTAYFNGQQVTYARGDSLKQVLLGYSNYQESSILSKDIRSSRMTLMADLAYQARNGKINFNFSGYYSRVNVDWVMGEILKGQLLAPNISLFDSLGNRLWEIKGLPFNNFTGYFQNRLSILSTNYLLHSTIKFKLSKDIKLEASVGYQGLRTDEKGIIPISGQNPVSNRRGSIFLGLNEYRLFTPELQLHATKSWKNFHGDLMLGTSAIYQLNKRIGQTLDGYTNDSLLGDPAEALTNNTARANVGYRFTSLFARSQVDFRNRYFLDLTLRVDGSSRFAPPNRFAAFPSAGTSIILREVQPDSGKLCLLPFAKIRSSYGLTGNDQIGDFAYLNAWYRELESPGNPGNPGIVPSRLYNSGYKWQQTEKFEAALELGLFNNKASVVAAYFRNRTSDQLINYLLPSQTGFTSITTNFPAVVQNSGFEFQARLNFKRKRFSSTSILTFSTLRNKLLRFPDIERTPYSQKLVVGQSLTVQRGALYGGVGTADGLYKLADTARKYIAGNKDAAIYGGLQHICSFNDALKIEFAIDWRIAKANHFMASMYNHLSPGQLNEGLQSNQYADLVNSWQSPGENARWQKPGAAPGDATEKAIANWINSTAVLENASFMRLRYVRISYNIEEGLQKWHAKKLGFFIQAQNLITIKAYPSLDPELPDPFVLPPLRTISAGIEISF